MIVNGLSEDSCCPAVLCTPLSDEKATELAGAFAVAADVALAAGGLAADRTYASLKGIATRTLPGVRFHLNGQYTFGAAPDAGESEGEASRWMAGLAVDHSVPFHSTLVTADAFAESTRSVGSTPTHIALTSGLRAYASSNAHSPPTFGTPTQLP